jgi:hypothetical protein
MSGKPNLPDPAGAVRWVLGPHVRADLVGYTGTDVTGGQLIAQIYPSGFRDGTIDGTRIQSIAIGAPVGVRVVLCATGDEGEWQAHPWRCIRVMAGQTWFTKEGVPAVRVPDLEWLHPFDQKKSGDGNQVSYPFAATLAEGTGWTFGRPGPLKLQVRMIRVEHEDRPITP